MAHLSSPSPGKVDWQHKLPLHPGLILAPKQPAQSSPALTVRREPPAGPGRGQHKGLAVQTRPRHPEA